MNVQKNTLHKNLKLLEDRDQHFTPFGPLSSYYKIPPNSFHIYIHKRTLIVRDPDLPENLWKSQPKTVPEGAYP